MKTFDDIKSLWQQNIITKQQPNASNILNATKANSKSITNRLLYEAIALILCIAWFIGCIFLYKFLHMQIVALIICMFLIAVYAIVKLLLYFKLKQIDFANTPFIVLNKLTSFYNFQQWVNTKGYLIFTLIIFVAMAFYAYPFWLLFSNTQKIVYPILYTAWFAFAILFVQKRKSKKQAAKVSSIIEVIQQRAQQLQES